MATRNRHWTLAQLMLVTAGVAVFCVVLLNENQWLRATYVTAALSAGLNALVAAILARGERQAFAIGFVAGVAFFAASALAASVTLPFLLTMELLEWLRSARPTPPSEEHFYIVTSVFWVLLTAISSGYLGRWWYRAAQAQKAGLVAPAVTKVVGD